MASSPTPDGPHARWAFALLGLLVLAVYLNSLGNGFTWDDSAVIENAPAIRSWANLPDLFSSRYFVMFGEDSYRPVVTLTYFVDRAFWGRDPSGYHLTNLVLHAAATMALFVLLRQLLDGAVLAAFAGAALFAVHPVNAEAVNSPGLREDLLCAAAYFLSLWSYMRWRRERRVRLAALSWGLFAFAILAKEMAAGLPFLIIAWEWLLSPDSAPGRVRRVALNLVPYGLLVAGVLALRAAGFQDTSEWYPHWGGGPLAALPNFPRAILHDLAWTVLPMNLHVERILPDYGGAWYLRASLSILAVAGLVAGALHVRRLSPLAAFAALFFMLALLPVSNVFKLRYFLADRYLYVPLAGVCLLIGVLVRGLGAVRYRRPALAFGAAALVLLGTLTALANRAWHNQFALWAHAVVHVPENLRVRLNLGTAYADDADRLRPAQGEAVYRVRMQKAIDQFDRASALNPLAAMPHHNTGSLLQDMGRWDEAEVCFRRAVELEPQLAKSHVGLARIERRRGRLLEALREGEAAVAAEPTLPDALLDLGQTCLELRQFERAARVFGRLLELYPAGYEPWLNLGLAYAGLKDDLAAEQMLRHVAEQWPSLYAGHFQLGLFYAKNPLTWAKAERELVLALRLAATDQDRQTVSAVLEQVKAGKGPVRP